jgi:hypothetical protein
MIKQLTRDGRETDLAVSMLNDWERTLLVLLEQLKDAE